MFVLLIPIFDTTLVTVARLLSGRSPAVGGRDHSSHRLVAIGLSERAAVLLLWGLAAIGGAIGLIAPQHDAGLVDDRRRAVPARLMGLFAVYLARVRVYADAAAPPARESRLTPLVERVHAQAARRRSADGFHPDRSPRITSRTAGATTSRPTRRTPTVLQLAADRHQRAADLVFHRRRVSRPLARV